MRLYGLNNLVRAFNASWRKDPLGLIKLKEELKHQGRHKDLEFLTATYSKTPDLNVLRNYRAFFPIDDDYQLRPGRGCEVIYVGDLKKFKQTASYYFTHYLINEAILSQWTPTHGYLISIPEWKYIKRLTIATDLSPGRVSTLQYIYLDHIDALTLHLQQLDSFIARELINLKLKATELTLVTRKDVSDFKEYEELTNRYNLKILKNDYHLQEI